MAQILDKELFLILIQLKLYFQADQLHCNCAECDRHGSNPEYDLNKYLLKKFHSLIDHYGIEVRNRRRRSILGIATAADLDRVMQESIKLSQVSYV